MVYRCCVNWCLLNLNHNSGVQLHKFPKDSAICEKWVAAVATTKEDGVFELMQNHRICSKHFDKQYWIKNRYGEILRLRPGAIPTIFDNDRLTLISQNSVTVEVQPMSIAKPSSLLHPDGIHEFDCKSYQGDETHTKLKRYAIPITLPEEWSSEKKRKLHSHACEFSEQDLEMPHKRKLFWNAFHIMRHDNLLRLKFLEQQKQRSKIKINTLNNLVDRLRNNDQNVCVADSFKVIDIGLQSSV